MLTTATCAPRTALSARRDLKPWTMIENAITSSPSPTSPDRHRLAVERAGLRAHVPRHRQAAEAIARRAVDAAHRQRLQQLGADARIQVQRAQQIGHRARRDAVRVAEPRAVLGQVAARIQPELAEHVAQHGDALVGSRRPAQHLGADRLEQALGLVVVRVLVDLAQHAPPAAATSARPAARVDGPSAPSIARSPTEMPAAVERGAEEDRRGQRSVGQAAAVKHAGAVGADASGDADAQRAARRVDLDGQLALPALERARLVDDHEVGRPAALTGRRRRIQHHRRRLARLRRVHAHHDQAAVDGQLRPLFVDGHRPVVADAARVGDDAAGDALDPARGELVRQLVELARAQRGIAAAAQVEIAFDHAVVVGRRAVDLGAKRPVAAQAHQRGRRRQHLLVRRRIHQRHRRAAEDHAARVRLDHAQARP